MLSALAGMGAAQHLVPLAEALRARGHRVSVVSAPDALDAFEHLDVELHAVAEPPMPELLQTLPPLAQRARQVFARVQSNVIDPLPAQWEVVRDVIADAAVDVVVSDALFLGGAMLSVLPREDRPAVVLVGFFPPWIPDPAVPPYGLGLPPADNGMNRVRAAGFELLASRAYARLSRSFNTQVERTFGVPRKGDLRSSPAGGDAWVQLTVPRFEYPRTALPPNFRFVGPLHPGGPDPVPDWWDPRAEPPVVVVRVNGESGIDDLVLPSIRAFEDSADTVVVAGVSRAAVAHAFRRPLPATVHFEDRPPWSRLIPQRSVVISDGDYLHTQHALRRGVPLVVAGTLETDVETAARVAWTGAGVDLRTRRPEPSAIREAVERIRGDGAYRIAAAKIAAQIASTDAETELCELVETLSTR